MMSAIRPGRLSLIAVAAISHSITHAATPAQLFGRDEPECQICGQRGHCSAECPKGMVGKTVIKGRFIGMSEAIRRATPQQPAFDHFTVNADGSWVGVMHSKITAEDFA